MNNTFSLHRIFLYARKHYTENGRHYLYILLTFLLLLSVAAWYFEPWREKSTEFTLPPLLLMLVFICLILYDTFTSKYGLLNSRANTSAFSQDSSYSLLSALEILDDEGNLERKADMFFKRTIKPHTPVTSVDTSSEALAVSMGEKAYVDMEYMCQLSGKTEEEIYSDLKGVIFLNPMYGYGNSTEAKYLMADEYLSGNVREKLAWAKRSAELSPDDYKIHVEALEKVQPKDLTASEISVRLGATWLPPEIVEQFIFEFLGTPSPVRSVPAT